MLHSACICRDCIISHTKFTLFVISLILFFSVIMLYMMFICVLTAVGNLKSFCFCFIKLAVTGFDSYVINSMTWKQYKSEIYFEMHIVFNSSQSILRFCKRCIIQPNKKRLWKTSTKFTVCSIPPLLYVNDMNLGTHILLLQCNTPLNKGICKTTLLVKEYICIYDFAHLILFMQQNATFHN